MRTLFTSRLAAAARNVLDNPIAMHSIGVVDGLFLAALVAAIL